MADSQKLALLLINPFYGMPIHTMKDIVKERSDQIG